MNAGKLEIVVTRMEEQSINILGISETWWLQQGRFRTEDGYTVVYSGKDSGRREQGVGIIMDKTTAKSFMGFNPISSRIITLRLQGHPFNITIVQVRCMHQHPLHQMTIWKISMECFKIR